MEPHKPLLRAVGYRRVSMREQVDGYSLEAQEVSIRQYITQQGWELVELYTDAGISAKKGSHRPGLEALLHDATTGKFDVIVVDKIDRFYRYLNGLLTALDKLNQEGVSFASVKEKLDFTTPWGKLMLTVLGMLAEIYLDNLRQETRKGKLQRARQGLWNGNPPYGYCRGLCSHCQDPNGEGYCPNFGNPDLGTGAVLIAHPIESVWVKQAFAWYLTTEYSDAKIADALNAAHHVLPNGTAVEVRHKGIAGRVAPGKFSKDMVRGMLSRIFYTGKIPYFSVTPSGKSRKRQGPEAVFPGQHPALIDEASFAKVQELREIVKRSPRFRGTVAYRFFPLTGLLHCLSCGRGFRGTSGKKGNYYYRDNTQIDHTGTCAQPLLRAAVIESKLMSVVREILTSYLAHHQAAHTKEQFELADARWQRARMLFLAGELEREAYEREKNTREILEKSLQGLSLDAIIAVHQELKKPDENGYDPLNTKKQLRLTLEAAWVQEHALVAIQVAPLLLPYIELGGKSGPDGDRPNFK